MSDTNATSADAGRQSEPKDLRDPAQMLFSWILRAIITIWILSIVTTFIVALIGEYARLSGPEASPFLTATAKALAESNDFISGFSSKFWFVASPLLSLAILLLIVDWFLRRIGLKLPDLKEVRNLNVQGVIAVLVIASLCFAVFVSADAASSLKEIALVVVGFYFGSRSQANRDEKSDVTS